MNGLRDGIRGGEVVSICLTERLHVDAIGPTDRFVDGAFELVDLAQMARLAVRFIHRLATKDEIAEARLELRA